MIPCERCGEYKPLDQFEQNDKLEHGVSPWCRDCIKWLALLPDQLGISVGQLRQARQEYRVAYQRSYQNAYKGRTDGKTTTKKRRIERFTKVVAHQILVKDLSVITLRRDEVQSEWARLLPLLRRTHVWEEFEDEVIARSGRENEQGLEIHRILSEELYPEFCLTHGNCVANQPNQDAFFEVTLTSKEVHAGFERLIACVEECLG